MNDSIVTLTVPASGKPSSPRSAATRRMPMNAKSQQRVRQILSVGRDVFSERGYEHATTAEIAQRVGIAEATVFSYFSSKRELCARTCG